jgi:hypothetical protein
MEFIVQRGVAVESRSDKKLLYAEIPAKRFLSDFNKVWLRSKEKVPHHDTTQMYCFLNPETITYACSHY